MAVFSNAIPKTLAKRSLRVSKHIPSTYRHLFTQSAPVKRSPVQTTLYTTAFVLSAGIIAAYYFDARSAIHRYFFTPILRNTLDAETSHKFALKILKSGLAPRDICADDVRLKTKIWGTEVSNPIGIAAGFDKDGEAVDGLFNLGFSWVEIGSVTPKPQPGNPQPRVFRLEEDAAIINRYGFPSQGHAHLLSRLRARIPRFFSNTETAALRDGALLAVNLGKNKEAPADSIDDFLTGVQTFGLYADVLVVNVSSPNTPGLRGLQNRDLLEKLLDGVVKARDELQPSPLTSGKPKIVLKIAPDLEEPQLTEMAKVMRNSRIDGVIVSNTTIQRPKTLINGHKIEAGGLSGPPVKPSALKAVQIIRSQLPSSIPIIGCGGITTGKDALEYAKAGAGLVQVYTSFTYDGVGACRRIKDQVAEELAKEGKTWEQVVNEAVSRLSWRETLRVEEKPEEGLTVQQLIGEAKELDALLDKLV